MKYSFQADRDSDENSHMFQSVLTEVVKSAINDKVICNIELSSALEVLPSLFEMAGLLRDKIYYYHRHLNKPLQFPILQQFFCYAFAKGTEAAYQWRRNPKGKISLNYDLEDILNGLVGAQVDERFANLITKGMINMANVFCDFQNNILVKPEFNAPEDGRFLADTLACGLASSSLVGLDYGLNKIGFN